ncbi:MAG: ABC transporter permease [Sphaerochaetaceae bacterium]|nr:ABC transporter permease [Sphaerochaetaceae bacterium]
MNNTIHSQDSIDQLEMVKGESFGYKAVQRFKRHKLAMFGLVVLGFLLILTIVVPIFIGDSAYELNFTEMAQSPSLKHISGTDSIGRDIFARLMIGGRVSLSVGLVSVIISTTIGVILGGLAGYFGGKVDMIIMRFTDTIMCFPYLVIVMTLVAVLGPSLFNTMFAIGVLSWTRIARITRGEFLHLREMQFIEADRSLGIKTPTIIFGHLLPNALSPVIVSATFNMANAILMEAGLSFLGLGVQLPTPSWGNMLQEATTLTILETMPWVWIPAGILIAVTVLSINFIGDGLRDAMDPKMML